VQAIFDLSMGFLILSNGFLVWNTLGMKNLKLGVKALEYFLYLNFYKHA
jgi:hypothetical protein